MLNYQGRWRVTVVGKQADWQQRVVIGGASLGAGFLAGTVGASEVVDGDHWTLTVEHDAGGGWQTNEGLLADPPQENGAQMTQVVRSKDHYTPGDPTPNDLVLQLEKLGPMFDLVVRPYAVDAESMMMLADGIFVGLTGLQYMGVEVRNTWGEAFEDEVVFDISDLGRATLAAFGIQVIDTWSPESLAATGQTLVGRGVRLPQLAIGKSTTVYFQVDASGAHHGKPDVEFVLLNLVGTPDPASPLRHNRRQIFIADVNYDRATGEATVVSPEGIMRLKMQSMMVDIQAVDQLCGQLKRGGPGGAVSPSAIRAELDRLFASRTDGKCDQQTVQALIGLLCRCLGADCGCDGSGKGGQGGGGLPRVCQPGGFWLPLRFEYGVEINGGFVGQHGPLAFQDPWWKVVLLIIAFIAWLVGVIEQAVADKTGWGNQGSLPLKIGTVGTSNRVTTDACIIELDGSRPAEQKVADVITGEPNNQPIVGVDTVITVVPQVALPTLTSAAVVGQHVYKSGSRTGLTHGIISSFGAFTQSRDPGHPDLVFANPQFSITADPAFGEQLFDDSGDSGSLVLSREPATMNQVVGIVHSASGGTTPIQDVLAALDLKLH